MAEETSRDAATDRLPVRRPWPSIVLVGVVAVTMLAVAWTTVGPGSHRDPAGPAKAACHRAIQDAGSGFDTTTYVIRSHERPGSLLTSEAQTDVWVLEVRSKALHGFERFRCRAVQRGDRVRYSVRQSDRGPQADRVERL